MNVRGGDSMSSGVSVRTGRAPGTGRHGAACPAMKRFGVRATAAPLAAAVVTTAVVYLLAAAALEAAGRGIARTWNRIGTRWRLILLMIGAYPLSHGGSELGLLPDGTVPDGVCAAVIVAGAGLGLLWLRRSGQREWREGRGRSAQVLTGGWQNYAREHQARADEAIARIGRLEGKFDEVFNLIELALDAAGSPVREPVPPRLRLVVTNHDRSRPAGA